MDQSDYNQFNTIRNKVKRMIMMLWKKKAHKRRICGQSTNNSKRFWKHIRDNLKTKSGIFPLLESANDKRLIKFSDHDKAKILQDQFCSVFVEEPDGDLPTFMPRTEKEERVR